MSGQRTRRLRFIGDDLPRVTCVPYSHRKRLLKVMRKKIEETANAGEYFSSFWVGHSNIAFSLHAPPHTSSYWYLGLER